MLIQLLVVLIILAVVVALLPTDPKFKQLAYIVAAIAVALVVLHVVLNYLGVFPGRLP